jgi:hypothetical protein
MNSHSVRLQEQQQHPIAKNERKKVIGQPVESFSNNVGVDRTIKQACSVGGDLLPSFQRIFLQLPTDKNMLLLAEFTIDSYHEKNIAVAMSFSIIFASSMLRVTQLSFCSSSSSPAPNVGVDVIFIQYFCLLPVAAAVYLLVLVMLFQPIATNTSTLECHLLSHPIFQVS